MAAAVEERHASAEQVADFRAALGRALADAAADERTMTLLRAIRLRVRLICPDADLVLDVSAGDDPREPLRWSFSDEGGPPPKLELEMGCRVANGYLQERESIAVAIARGRVKTRGDAKTALLYLPALRLIARPYRRVVADAFPRLALD